MRRRWNATTYVIFGLIGIGIVADLIANPRGMLIPIIIFGVVFYLYKFPPKRFNSRNSAYAPNRTKTNRQTERKEKEKNVRKANFRVIKGEKGNEEEPPRYH